MQKVALIRMPTVWLERGGIDHGSGSRHLLPELKWLPVYTQLFLCVLTAKLLVTRKLLKFSAKNKHEEISAGEKKGGIVGGSCQTFRTGAG